MIRHKILYILFTIFLLVLNCSNSNIVQPPQEPLHGWIVQHPEYGINEFYAVDFADDNNGWIAGSDGALLHTNDRGKTWNHQVSSTSSIIYNSFFINSLTGFYITLDGQVFKTIDGGNNWEVIYKEDNLWLRNIHFINQNNGWICGASRLNDTSSWIGTLLSTDNGG